MAKPVTSSRETVGVMRIPPLAGPRASLWRTMYACTTRILPSSRRGVSVNSKRDFGYDSKLGRVYRGQVFTPGGHVNDEVLLRNGYLEEFKGEAKFQDSSGRWFRDEWSRNRANEEEARRKMEAELRAEDRARALRTPPMQAIERAQIERRRMLVGA